MRGLSLPYHMRCTSSALRRDLATAADLLQQNLGRGHYRFDDFNRVPAVDTDASKSPRYVGGGYFSRSGHHRIGFMGVPHAVSLLIGWREIRFSSAWLIWVPCGGNP
eukprot:1054163-Pleurochrysis_carterae.AAC.1